MVSTTPLYQLDATGCIDDFFDLTDPADRVQPFEKVMSFRFMHGSVDRSRRYGVYTNAVLRVFNGEGACHRVQRALQKRKKSGVTLAWRERRLAITVLDDDKGVEARVTPGRLRPASSSTSR